MTSRNVLGGKIGSPIASILHMANQPINNHTP